VLVRSVPLGPAGARARQPYGRGRRARRARRRRLGPWPHGAQGRGHGVRAHGNEAPPGPRRPRVFEL